MLLSGAKKQPHILVIGDIMADRYVWGRPAAFHRKPRSGCKR